MTWVPLKCKQLNSKDLTKERDYYRDKVLSLQAAMTNGGGDDAADSDESGESGESGDTCNKNKDEKDEAGDKFLGNLKSLPEKGEEEEE